MKSIFLEQLMEQGAVKRSGRGRPRIRPSRVVGDKGYTGRRIRSYLRRRGIRFTIPRLSNELRRGPFSHEIYRQRNSELNVQSADSSNGDVLLHDMRNLLQIIQLRSRSPVSGYGCSLKTRPRGKKGKIGEMGKKEKKGIESAGFSNLECPKRRKRLL